MESKYFDFDITRFINELHSSSYVRRFLNNSQHSLYGNGMYEKGPECFPISTDIKSHHSNSKYDKINLYNDYAGKQIGFNKLWP